MKYTLYLVILLTLVPLPACSHNSQPAASRFTDPDPANYVKLAPIVREYFYHRKNAVISGELDEFYARYPALASDADRERGINAEAYHVAIFKGFNFLDGDIFPEYYQRLKIKEAAGEIQLLVHGLELYLYQNSQGNYDQSGGEFKIVLYLRPIDEGWELYQTDEVTLAEWKEFQD